MCDFCKMNAEIIYSEKIPGICDIEVFIENDKKLSVNTYNHEYEITEEIFCTMPIKYCPMCGKKLEE